MLLSILISLSPTTDIPIFFPLGRPVNAWLLGLLAHNHTNLASTLHNERGIKPYTVSTLLNHYGQPFRMGKRLQPGELCWLRITSLEPALSEILLREILPHLPDRLSLYEMDFRINGWSIDPAQHPWAASSSYQDISQMASKNANSRQLTLEFVTPTAFHSAVTAHKNADVPLPIPIYVFRSYWQKWNAFSPELMHVDQAWLEFVEACIIVKKLTGINTTRWVISEGSHDIINGFTGTAGFTLLPKHLCGHWAEFWDGADTVLQTLVNYAFYCGTGHHTTIGCGQTKLLPQKVHVVNSAI